MGSPARERERLEGLDILRLFAALSVVLYHYAFRGAAADGFTRVALPALVPVAKYGYLGVDGFFVISGFVIAASAEGRPWRAFAIARFARIYPAFVFCMTTTFVLTWWLGLPPFETSLGHWAANLLIAAPVTGMPFMDGAYWSIVYELVFYGWVTLLMAAGLFPGRAQPLLMAWLGLSIVNELGPGSDAFRKLLVTDHSGFFAAGVALHLLRRGERAWISLVFSAIVAVGQVLNIAEQLREHYRIALNDVVLVASALGAIGAVAGAASMREMPLRPGVAAALGGLTYPLYLLHQNVGYIVFNRLESVMPAPMLVALTTLTMVGVAWAVWKYVEPPCRRLIDRRLRPRSLETGAILSPTRAREHATSR